MAPKIDGRVFTRLQQFAALHGDFQEEVKELEVYLTANKTDIFGPHHANLVKTIRSIRAKPLLEKIDAWLLSKNAPVVAEQELESVPAPVPAPTTDATAAEQVTPATEEVTPTPTTEGTPAPETPAVPTETPEQLAAKAAATAEATAARLAHAKKLLEALVLRGFVTPYKEQEKLPDFTASAAAVETPAEGSEATTTETKAPAPLVFKDSELLVPVAPEVADDASVVTVWQLVDGAVYAGVLKRKAGFLAPLTQGKDVYAVINKRLKSLTLFETDVGRHPIVHFEAGDDEASPKANVSFDKGHFSLGIKVWNDVATELLNAASTLERETIVHALVSVGLQYREEPTINVEAIKSIYELKDVGLDGQEISFDAYKGKVLLVVNVSSKCGLTPTNYPELVSLDEKYRELGLVVLGFPCNQFWGQEPGTDEEIKAFVAQYNVQFPLFVKGDVNGTETRSVFAYLKAKQSGESGNYIQWNFAKFLVDRNGQPVARYGPMEKPLSFESEIVKLLSEEAKPEIVEETKAETEATVATVETAAVVATAPVVETAAEAAVVETAGAVVEAPVVVTETVVAEVVPPPAPVAAVEEKAAVVTVEKTAEATTTTTETVVKTLSVEKLPLPVEETKPAPETKVEVELKPAAAAAGEDFATTTTATTTSKTEELTTETAQVVQGFTPGNEPVP